MSELRVPDFDALYAADPDPWRIADRPYEQHKLGVVAASLSRPSYAVAWDLACGTGQLTQLLADRCTRVVAADLAAPAVALTRRRCAEQTHVDVRHSVLPAAPADGESPDLILLSEVFYYLDDRTRRDTLAMIGRSAAPRCEVVAVHWNGAPDDAWLSGPAAQQEVVSQLLAQGWQHRVRHVEHVAVGEDGAPGFTLDTLVRSP